MENHFPGLKTVVLNAELANERSSQETGLRAMEGENESLVQDPSPAATKPHLCTCTVIRWKASP